MLAFSVFRFPVLAFSEFQIPRFVFFRISEFSFCFSEFQCLYLFNPTATDRVKSRSSATASLRAWLAMPPFILIRALSCPAPRVMETQHKELYLGKLDSHPQRTIANPRQIAWNQQPNLLQHSNDCGQTTITSFPGRQPGADEHKRWRPLIYIQWFRGQLGHGQSPSERFSYTGHGSCWSCQ